MVLVNELRAEMVRKGFTQASLAAEIGVSPKTLSAKFKKGVFDSDEMQRMVDVLAIKDPARIFFARKIS